MAQEDGLKKLKTALVCSILANLVYGIGFFLTPGMLRDMSGGTPVELGWIRWSGGALLALAVGGFQVYQDPAGQRPMVTTLTVAPILISLGLLYPLLFEKYTVQTWFIVMPCIITFALFVVMLWGLQAAKNILKQNADV